jgi:ribosome maturation protein SDO1
MERTSARIKKGGKHYEILVDLDEAMKVKRGEKGANLVGAVLTEFIFHNLKSGEHASSEDLVREFGTGDVIKVSEKIIKEGEVVRTAESMRAEQERKYKQVVNFLVKNAVSPNGHPYTPDRIMKALSEAQVSVKNKPIESQVSEIVDQLSKVLPIKIEMKKVKLTVPAQHVGRAYGVVKEFMVDEIWMSNGDLQAFVEMPAGLLFDFYDKINSMTHGSVISEEIKD